MRDTIKCLPIIKENWSTPSPLSKQDVMSSNVSNRFVKHDLFLDGWMDGWMDGWWVGGWMDAVDRQI